MKIYSYPVKSLTGDYLRALAGLAVGVGVLLSVRPSPTIVAVFGGITILFLLFGLRTLRRHIARIGVNEEEICLVGLGTITVTWQNLEKLKLRYYGTRRQRQSKGGSGFMQMTLKGGGTTMTLDSALDGFDEVVWQAAKAARENGLSLDPASAGNLLDMGLDADADTARPESTPEFPGRRF